MLNLAVELSYMASLTFQNFIFFQGSRRPQTRFSANVVFIFQKSLNVWKDICLEAKHVGAHLLDQLKKKCVILRQRKINSGCLLSQILFTALIAYVYHVYYPTLSLLCMFQSYSDNLFCGSSFLYDKTLIYCLLQSETRQH